MVMIEMIAPWALWSRKPARRNRTLRECIQMFLEKWRIEAYGSLCRLRWWATGRTSFRNSVEEYSAPRRAIRGIPDPEAALPPLMGDQRI